MLLALCALGYGGLVLSESVAGSCKAGHAARWRLAGVVLLLFVPVLGAYTAWVEGSRAGTDAAQSVLSRRDAPPGSRLLRGLDVRRVTLRAGGTLDCAVSEGDRLPGVMLGMDDNQVAVLVPAPGGSRVVRVERSDTIVCQDETLVPGRIPRP